MRFLSVDPLADQFAAWSGYNYVLGNPLIFVDPDGKAPEDFVILIAKDGAGGKGHMTAVIQDGAGDYYYATMGAAGGTVSQMASGGVHGSKSLVPLTGAKSMDEAVSLAKMDSSNSPYTDEVGFETTSRTDAKIFSETSKMAKDVNSGKVEYNLFSMNCTDAVIKPIEKATGATLSDEVVPNKNFAEIKAGRTGTQNEINLNQGTHTVKYLPSGLDNYPSALRPTIVEKEEE
jgi:hypothetical protein